MSRTLSTSESTSESTSRLSGHRPARRHLVLLALVAGIGLALAVSATPRLDVALEQQYQLAAERPYDASVQNDLGNLLVLAGRDEAAAQAYERALEIDGSHVRARFNLGLLEQQNGRHEQALKQFEALLELEPEHAWAHYQSGVSLQEMDRRRSAVDHYARAFGYDPTLSFAENNPHIIDNTLVTEALLLSSKYSKTASRTVARQYDDADRIVSLMLEPEVTVEEEMDEGRTLEEMEKEAKREGRPVERATSSSGASLDPEPVPEPSDAGGETGDETAGTNNRVLTEDDLDAGVRIGGAVDSGSSGSRPDVRRGRSSSGGVDVRSPTRRRVGGEQAPRNPGDQRYRPSRRSSASLDLKLLPAENPEEEAAQEGVG